ncbi:MAG: hypothetical protein DRQ37_04550, partial [Gammaproteobacteria bacterium]
MEKFANAYDHWVLGSPRTVLVLLLAVLAVFSYHTKDFRLDASADSLLLEDDEDLRLFREVHQRYRTQDFLVVTFTPKTNLFSQEALATVGRLRDELATVESVDSVVGLLDVPLLQSSEVALSEMTDDVQTLETAGVDLKRAREEMLNSPVYRDLVLSADGQTTALLIYLHDDARIPELLKKRNALLAKKREAGLNAVERDELQQVSADFDQVRETVNNARHRDIQRIRTIMLPYKEHGTLYLGGVPMITDDMVAFVKSDLIVFGIGVLAFLVVVLLVIFRELRWVLLPLLSCFYAGTLMIGMLGLVGWKVTVIASNFLSLMLIITISMNIHLAVRYRQLHRDGPRRGQLDLVSTTVRKMVRPCLYTALTTIIGFSSLVFSNIKPVMDFGWMMSIGLAVTFATSFTLFPALLMLMGKPKSTASAGRDFAVTGKLAAVAVNHGNKVLVLTVVLAVMSAVGISRLNVENSFINYFSKDTEIYRGMKLIDDKLGGTTPLQVLLNVNEEDEDDELLANTGDEGVVPGDEDLDELEDLYEEEQGNPADYWFTPFKVAQIKKVHDYLDALPEVGKVLSLASAIRVGEAINDGKEFDSLQLALLYKRIPDTVRASMIDPYISIERNEARIALRILDSRPDLRRKELLERIASDLHTKLGLAKKDFTVSGILVLYNNMLQSLYTSQISTLGVVMAGIAIMFLILFRSFTLAVIGIVPNVLAACIVLGMMGLVGIPLDMMTITIAAITIGIAVDNSIHYIYRFREEYAQSGDAVQTLHVCHANIG